MAITRLTAPKRKPWRLVGRSIKSALSGWLRLSFDDLRLSFDGLQRIIIGEPRGYFCSVRALVFAPSKISGCGNNANACRGYKNFHDVIILLFLAERKWPTLNS